MLKKKSILSVVLAFAMMFAFASTAMAATTDPNLTNYDTYYTYSATAGEALVPGITLQVIPANASYTMTGFTNSTDADAVDWTFVGYRAGAHPQGITIARHGFGKTTDGLITATAGIEIDDTAVAGTYSVQATNKKAAGNPTMNFTIVVNPQAVTQVSGVKYQIYDATGKLSEGTVGVVAGKAYSDKNWNFPTAIDAAYLLTKATGVVGGAVTNVGISSWESGNPYSSMGYSLDSITVGGKELVGGANYNYWFYRVYDANGRVVPTSENVGLSDQILTDNCTVVLKYGAYGSVTFGNTLAQN